MSVANLTILKGLPLDRESDVYDALNPDLFVPFADAPVFGGLVLTTIELGPELAVSGAVALVCIDKHAVVFAIDLSQRISKRL